MRSIKQVWRFSLGEGAVEGFKDNRHEIMTFGTLDLLESLDVVVLRTVHNRKNLRFELSFVSRPLTARARVERFQRNFLSHKEPAVVFWLFEVSNSDRPSKLKLELSLAASRRPEQETRKKIPYHLKLHSVHEMADN